MNDKKTFDTSGELHSVDLYARAVRICQCSVDGKNAA